MLLDTGSADLVSGFSRVKEQVLTRFSDEPSVGRVFQLYERRLSSYTQI